MDVDGLQSVSCIAAEHTGAQKVLSAVREGLLLCCALGCGRVTPRMRTRQRKPQIIIDVGEMEARRRELPVLGSDRSIPHVAPQRLKRCS